MSNTGKAVDADKGYDRAQRREQLTVLGLKDGIQRKTHKNKPLSDCQHKRNQCIAKTRAKVEHVFADIRHMGGKHIRTIGLARPTVAMTMMAECYNLKRLASFMHRGVDAFSIKPSPQRCNCA